MELGLSLGDAPARPPYAAKRPTAKAGMGLDPGFYMGLGVGLGGREEAEERMARSSADPPAQLDLLPLVPVPKDSTFQLGFPWAIHTVGNLEPSMRGIDVNRVPSSSEAEEVAAVSSSSPNSAASSFQMDFSTPAGAGDGEGGGGDAERASSRASDEDENGLARKKLRLSKEQSVFLEESFKEHNTLNPKQKLALAKQLNLRPRQVEVWFQNRRARTKLKQTEVDCEYLKRCCETLTDENRRLQKELGELRALKTAHPFYMHLPATTLSMCPSCERVSSSSAAAAATNPSSNVSGNNKPASFAALFAKPRIFPFGPQPVPPHQPSAPS